MENKSFFINPDADARNLIKEKTGVEIPTSLKKVKKFEHLGPLLFYKLFELFGKNFHHITLREKKEILAFEVDTNKNISLEKGFFTMTWSMDDTTALVFYIRFSNFAYGSDWKPDYFEKVEHNWYVGGIDIGYMLDQTSSFCRNTNMLPLSKPSIHVDTAKAQGFLKEDFFDAKFFFENIIKEMIVPLRPSLEYWQIVHRRDVRRVDYPTYTEW